LSILWLKIKNYDKYIVFDYNWYICVKALLNKYIYKANKEFYNCSLDKIIEAITKCIKI